MDDPVLLCLLITTLQLLAPLDQAAGFYWLLRRVMPVLAVMLLVSLAGLELDGRWLALVLVSGLVFVPFDRLPRPVWLPINLTIAGVHLGLAGTLALRGLLG